MKLLSFLLPLAVGCHAQPAIKSFSVIPQTYCPSSTHEIDIDWNTEKGAATLQIAPDDTSPRKVAPSGKTSIPPHDVTITLTVAEGELAPHEIKPVRAAGKHSMSANASKCAGGWAATEPTDFGGGDKAFDPRAHPSLISNACAPGTSTSTTCHRAVKVDHEGKSWRIPPGGILDLSADTVSAAGPWTIAQELLPGEDCGTPTASAALEVDLSVEFDCK